MWCFYGLRMGRELRVSRRKCAKNPSFFKREDSLVDPSNEAESYLMERVTRDNVRPKLKVKNEFQRGG